MTEEERPQLVWSIENTHPELVESLKEALREVMDPEIGLNIIELGLIRDVVIEDTQAVVTMIMTTPFCPYAPALLEMARQKSEAALGRPTKMALGMQAWEPWMMEEGAGAAWGFF
ncbi:MAG TPA: iron-sulfur cluster assembly protein [Anaerolineales bacterium]|nr:iron-sulfur cluster assembly protein [Anaerolineales bacterium]